VSDIEYGDYRTMRINSEQTFAKQDLFDPVKTISTETKFASDRGQTVPADNQLVCDVDQFAQLRLAEGNQSKCEDNQKTRAAPDAFYQLAVENELASPVQLLSKPAFDSGSLSEFDLLTRKKENPISDEWRLLFADVDVCAPCLAPCDGPSPSNPRTAEPSHQPTTGSRSVESFHLVGSGVMLVDLPLTLAPEDHERVARMERFQVSMTGSSHG